MPTATEEAEAIEIELVLEAIHRRYGYNLREYVPDTVARRLRAALARSGAAHWGELQHRLLHDANWFRLLLDQLTVQVSDMFRDPHFFRVFRERVVPVLRTYPTLKLWLAGCSSGEEVYATAILLAEADLYERSQIYATDVSSKALDAAREGVYALEQAEGFARNYQLAGGAQRFESYYVSAYGRIAMRDDLKKNVVFFEHNLATDYAIGEMHVIFCRNVLFYFDTPLRRRVLDTFAAGLCNGGFLCLGATEAAPVSSERLFSGFAPEQRIFRRAGAA
jgi:chemotaxis protein methyltransferase CheR